MATKTILRPGVQVQQELLENSPVISLPDQPTVIVGPNVQVVEDAADGIYDTTTRLSAYPGLESGAKVRLDSVRVRLTNAQLDIAMGADGVVAEDILTSASVNFGSGAPLATKTTSAVAAAITAFVAPGNAMDPGPYDLKVEAGLAAGSFVFSYNGVKSAQYDAWPVAPNASITINGGTAGTITFTAAAQAPEVLPATDKVTVVNRAFVKVGDTVRFGAVEPYTEAKVAAVLNGGTQIRLDREPGDGQELAFTILRNRAAAISVPADLVDVSADGFTLSNNITVDEAFDADTTLNYMVISANVRVDYEALRQVTANRLTVIEKAGDVEAKLMKVSDRNPLALGTSIAKQNTIRSVFAMAVDEDSTQGYLRALAALETENVYAIVCLTQRMAVATALKSHVSGMSDKAKSKFRIGWFNLEHPFERTIVQKTGAGTFTAVDNEQSVRIVTLVDPNASFAGRVLVGDILQTLARPAEGELPTADQNAVGIFRVREVLNNSRLRLEETRLDGSNGVYAPESAPDDAPADWTAKQPLTAANSVDYEVIRVLDRDGQAEEIAITADSFQSRRMVCVTNAEVVVTVNDVDVTVPGYYLAAALAGMCSGFPPHQGFTNLGISGIKSVRYANRYFNDDQMGFIAGSGGFLVVQDGETSMPVAFIQTTTDNSSIQTRELSFTRVLDFYCSFLKNQLRQYIGPYNIYQATFTTLSNAVNAVHQEMLGMSYDKIGTPILAASLDKLEKDPTRADGISIVSTIVIPLPLNNISVKVQA